MAFTVGMGKKRIFSKRLPLSSKTKREVRWYSPEICPPHASVCMTASRVKPYSFRALRNSASFCVNARMMRAVSSGAPERLTACVACAGAVCAAAADASRAADRNEKRTLFIKLFLDSMDETTRGLFGFDGKPPAEQTFRCGLKVTSCKFKVPGSG